MPYKSRQIPSVPSPKVLKPKAPNDQIEEIPLPQNTYKVIDPAPSRSYDQFAGADPSILSQVSAAAEEPKPQVAPPPPRPPRLTWAERIAKFKENPIRVYCAAGLGLGILLAILIGVVSSLLAPPNGRYDLGPATAAVSGLNGRLYLQWDKKLQYRLTLAPTDSDQQASFALAVANPPQPLSVQIHLLDSMGFVLCSQEILLRDSAQAAEQATRERGRDVFQNQTGPDGQTSTISAQGVMPCSAKAYEQAENWNFTTNFPSPAEQNELLKRQSDAASSAERQSAEASSARKKTVAKAAAPVVAFSVEGDDAVVDFDAGRGAVVTRGRKTFFIDKTTAASASARWQDYPVLVHYSCDRTLNCTLRGQGAGTLRAKLSK